MVHYVDVNSSDPQQMLLYNLFKCLVKKEVSIICYRFGLFGTEKISLAKMGKILKKTANEVLRLERKALDKLRTRKGIYGIENEELLGALVGYCDCGCLYRPRARHWHMGLAFVCHDCYEKRIFNQGKR